MDRSVELRLSAWMRIHERLTEEETRRENEIVVMRPGRMEDVAGLRR
jgi:hypothetical protein